MADNKPILVRQASMKSFAGVHLVAALVALVGLVAAFRLNSFLLGAIALVLVAGAVGYTHLVRISTHYRIYDDHLEIESGIIAKNLENLKLFRVRDIGMRQGVLGRMLGFGDITLTSTDTSAPHIKIRNVDKPKEIYDQLSSAMAQVQAQRRTMIIEDMPIAEAEAQS